ncbi:PilN domain-containing protein [Desulfobulbus sp. F4]|nr:PilN domain-containing protein [Desulfobulbus sp. F3]MCW5200507.1 PilN domain-containing protein [Desulfobulbus sp. F4]
MLRINLLPVKKIKQQAEAWRQLKMFGVVFIVLLAVLAFVVFYLTNRINALDVEIARLEQRQKELAEIKKQIDELKEKKKAVDDQTNLIKQVEQTSALTAHVLDEVANLVPNDRLWLVALNQSASSLTMNGVALDNQTVAEFLEKLKKSPYINDDSVKLANATLMSQAGRSLKSFSLSCAVAMPAAEGEKEKAGAGSEGTAPTQKK